MRNLDEEIKKIEQSNQFAGSYEEYIQYSVQHATLDGIWLEFGVSTGDSLKILASYTNQPIYGFDSFEGLPEAWVCNTEHVSTLPKGTFSNGGITPQEVVDLQKKYKNINLIKGWFQDTLPRFIAQNTKPIALIHIDSDLYSSAKIVFNNLRNFIVPGVVILFDELFNYPTFAQYEMRALLEENFNYIYLSTWAPVTPGAGRAGILVTE